MSSFLRVQAIDLSQIEDVKLPLFDSEGGMRWGQLYFKTVSVQSSKAGPFEVSALSSARLSHLSLRFTYWPAHADLSVCLKPLAGWTGGALPESVPSFRLECEGQWALILEDLSLVSSQSPDQEARYSFRARKVIYVRSGQAQNFINTNIIYNQEDHALILVCPTHEPVRIQLPSQSI